MIECIFTVDYEIYGNGEGSLKDLVYEPARQLKRLFDHAGAKLVVFVEAAELEMITAAGTDSAIHDVQRQLREFHEQGHEIALHLHPQWYHARHRDGTWDLDYAEYNLCNLPRLRIEEIVSRAIGWLRAVLQCPGFTPVSFRAGNWLIQPTASAAQVLAAHGLQLDSSVFKGGRQHAHRLDFRAAMNNGWYWRFGSDVNVRNPLGILLEVPIYTRMVPFWQMLTAKRVGLQRKSASLARNSTSRKGARKLKNLRDYLRFRYPLKFDFCRMTLNEMTTMMETPMAEDRRTPDLYKPLVAIGHTKDLVDLDTIASFLNWLKERSIPVTTLEAAYPRCRTSY